MFHLVSYKSCRLNQYIPELGLNYKNVGIYDIVVIFDLVVVLGVFVLEGGYCFYSISPFTHFPKMFPFLS